MRSWWVAAAMGMFLGTARAGGRVPGLHGRTLWGHRFVSSGLLDDPFTVPYVDSGTEWGLYQFHWYWDEGSPWPWDDGRNIDLSMDTMAQSFRVSPVLWQRLALYAEVQGAFHIAANKTTALYQAADAGLAGGAGVKLKLWENRRFQLGTTVGGQRSRLITASPVNGLLLVLSRIDQFANEYLKYGEIPSTSDIASQSFWNDVMFDQADYGNVRGGLQFAWGIHQAAGVWVQANGEFAESKVVGLYKRDLFMEPGIGLSLDGKPLADWAPVGLVLSYMGILPGEPSSGYGEEYRLGIFYTGRDYVDVGIELQDHKDVARIHASKRYWQGYADEVRTRMRSVRTRVRVYF